MKPKSQSQSARVKGSKPETVKRFLGKLSVKLLKCFCLVPYCSETNVKNALGAAIFPQENQAIEQQKLEGVKFRQIQNVKPQQPLHHKSKLGLSSGNSNSSLANKTQNEDRKVRESAAPTPITQFATEIGSIHQSISSKDWLAVRKLQVPQKVKSFVWRCLQNALATQEQLVKRGCKEDATCPICGIGNESIEHALFLCSKASMVWFGSSLNIRCQAIENMNFKAWWKQMLQVLRVEDSDYRLELAVIQCWQIWKHRNNEVFNGLIYDPKQVVSKAYNQWRKWISCNSKSVTEATLPTMEKRGKPQLTLTRPKEPEFETAQRVRSVKIKSSAELEEEMMAKIPKFKARPVNKKIFEAPTLPALPRSTPRLPEFKEFHLQTAARANQNAETASIASTEVSHQSQWKPHHLTEPKSPLLHTTLRARPTMVKSSLEIEKEELEKIPKFKARPLNKKIFESKGELGVFCNLKKHVTIPQEFHFATNERIPPPAAVADLFDKLSLNSEPHNVNPLPKNTLPHPFRLHTEERGAEKERKFVMELVQKQIEEERARVPKANPYPYTTDYPVIPPKPEPKPCTQPEPFQLESLVRHEEEMEREMEERLRMEKEEEEKRIFRAQPILNEDPIPLPEKVRKPLTQVQQFDLHVDHRAVDRAEFDQKVKEKELLYKRYREESEAARMIEEERALKQLRRTMVPHARPVPKFDHPFCPKKSSKAATKAKSPNLQVLRRKQRQRMMVNAVSSSPASCMR